MQSECEKIAAQMSDYVDEKLEPDKRAGMERHIAVCEDCRREAELQKQLVVRLRALSGQSVPFDLWPGVASHITEQHRRSFVGRLLTAAGWGALAIPAAAAAALLIFALRSPKAPAPVPQQASAEYRAYVQAYSSFRSAQPLSDPAAIAAAAQLQRREAVPH